MNQQIVNLMARMDVRHLRADRQFQSRWRPTSQNVSATRQLNGCSVKHLPIWDHEIVHASHGRHIAHSFGRCYFYFHRFPGEVGIQNFRSWVRIESRLLIRRAKWALLRLLP